MSGAKGPTKHKLKSDATRSALLQAAEAIFARDGFERAQIDEIASESGRTRGAVYAQYKTKEQLFFALQQQRIEAARHDVEEILSKIDVQDSGARFAAVREYYSDVHDPQAALLDLELKLYALRHPELAAEWREQNRRSYNGDRFARAFGISENPGWARVENRVAALSASKSGLVLAMRFLPEQLTTAETKLILLAVFDGLFPKTEQAPATAKRALSPRRKPKA